MTPVPASGCQRRCELHLGPRLSFRHALSLSVLLGAATTAPGQASAALYRYVDWTEADVAQGTASGTITLPDESTVTVEFAATHADGSPRSLYGAQIDGGTNYWEPSDPYISAEVENPPTGYGSPPAVWWNGRDEYGDALRTDQGSNHGLGQPGVAVHSHHLRRRFPVHDRQPGCWLPGGL